MSELQDLTALIRANTPLIVIETQDEGRVIELFRQALAQVWRALHRWSITEGLRRLDLDREDEPQGPPPGALVGGITGISKGRTADIPTTFTPGEYALICFVPDAKDGKAHLAHGMVKQFSVK